MSEWNLITSASVVPLPQIFIAWLDGLSVEETSQTTTIKNQSLITSQFMTFHRMEHNFHHPSTFQSHNNAMIRKMIALYYEFKPQVIREMFGRKLKSRGKRDFEEISFKTGTSMGSVRRHFDNIKRVSKAVEESEIPMATLLQDSFCMDKEMNKRYSVVIFIFENHLDTCCRQSKLLSFTFEDLYQVCELMLQHWTTVVVDGKQTYEQFDPLMVSDIKDIKQFLSSKEQLEELRLLVASLIETSVKELEVSSMNINPTSSQFQTVLRNLIRSIVSIGCSLTSAKDTKNLIATIVDKIIEAPSQAGWRAMDLNVVLHALEMSWILLGTGAVKPEPSLLLLMGSRNNSQSSLQVEAQVVASLEPSWKRLVKVIRLSTQILFNDLSATLTPLVQK